LTGMSWSRLRDIQGFGMQCVSYIRFKKGSFLSRGKWRLVEVCRPISSTKM
jgi:hypothetical protein